MDDLQGVDSKSVMAMGIGGAGCTVAQQFLTKRGPGKVRWIAVNTDEQRIAKMNGVETLLLGESGVPAGIPQRGRAAARFNRDAIAELVAGASHVYLFAGLGGGTGTGATAEIAQIARRAGKIVRAFVTMPFAFEGSSRLSQANDGVESLRLHCNSLVIVENESIAAKYSPNATWDDVLAAANDELIVQSGLA